MTIYNMGTKIYGDDQHQVNSAYLHTYLSGITSSMVVSNNINSNSSGRIKVSIQYCTLTLLDGW